MLQSDIDELKNSMRNGNPNVFVDYCCNSEAFRNAIDADYNFVASIYAKSTDDEKFAYSKHINYLMSVLKIRTISHTGAILFWLQLLHLSPNNSAVRKKVNELKIKTPSFNGVEMIMGSLDMLEIESNCIGLDSCHQAWGKKSFLLDELAKVVKFKYASTRVLKSQIPGQKQIRKDGAVVDRSDNLLLLEGFISQKNNLILAAIDFDDTDYLEVELFCKNMLIAMHDYTVSNSDYHACMVITGNIGKEFSEWLLSPIELRPSSVDIARVEVLYALELDDETFFYPLRFSSQERSLRYPSKNEVREQAWRYISLVDLLSSTVEQFNASSDANNFKTLLSNHFLQQVGCVLAPQRDAVDVTLAQAVLIQVTQEKFSDYIRQLSEKNSNRQLSELADVFVNLKITNSKREALLVIEKMDANEIHTCCMERFQIIEKQLMSNLDLSKKSKEGSLLLDWGHVIQDVAAKNIDYATPPSTVFNLDVLNEKLECYAEEIPFYSVETFITYIDTGKNSVHARGFKDFKTFDAQKAETNRKKRRETFWHAHLENAVINIINLVMRVPVGTNIESLANQLAGILFIHIDFKKNQSIYNFLTAYLAEIKEDFDSVVELNVLFNRENAVKLIDLLKKNINELKKGYAYNKSDYLETTQQQYNQAYGELVNSNLNVLGFSIYDLYKFVDNGSIESDIRQAARQEKMRISNNAFNNLLEFLGSLNAAKEIGTSGAGASDSPSPTAPLQDQVRNLYVKILHQTNYLLCKFIFVIVDDQITLAPESFFRPEGTFQKNGKPHDYSRPAHSQLAQGRGVQAAGECIFIKSDSRWSLGYITNGSGHYRPDAFRTLPLAEVFFRQALSANTLVDLTQLVLRNTITPNIAPFDITFLPTQADLNHAVPSSSESELELLPKQELQENPAPFISVASFWNPRRKFVAVAAVGSIALGVTLLCCTRQGRNMLNSLAGFFFNGKLREPDALTLSPLNQTVAKLHI